LGVKRLLAAAGVCLTVFAAAPAAAQFPLLQQPGQPGTFLDPQELEGTRKAPLTITPSFTLSEEYNDNVFLDNKNREHDFITGFTPGIAIVWERPTYRLAAGYNFTAELFARETEESHAFDRQNFFLDSSWKVDPFLTLSLTDTFIFSTDTNLISRESVATGRDRSWSNTLGGGAVYQLTEFWSLRAAGSYTVERFSRSGLEDSDVYRAVVGADRRLSSRLSAGVAYEFAYFDISNEPKAYAHTPRVGATWRATDTITLALSGGPTFEIQNGDTRVTPAITFSYAQKVFFGSIGIGYDRTLGTASGLGGPTDDDLVTGYINITTLLRGLTVQILPRYSNVQSPHSDRVDIRAFTLPIQFTYRFTEYVAAIAGYQFFHQRSDSTAVSSIGTPIANDADQNRVFFGITLGYPIRVD
jgi:hypothetical protein